MSYHILLVYLLCIGFSLNSIAADSVKVGGIFDITGSLSIYGRNQSKALKLAIKSINEQGGLLGKPVELIEYDAESQLDRYESLITELKNQNIDVLIAGVTSASREKIRPIIRRLKIPYFYTSEYEGGACDKYTFMTGATPSQQVGVLVNWAIENYGPTLYVVAPTYNFGTVSAHWIQLYANQLGGTILGSEYLSIEESNYLPTINRIQAAKPDFIFALPVGEIQTQEFIKAYHSSNLKIPIVSTTLGGITADLKQDMPKDAFDGIVSSIEYIMENTTTENVQLIKRWREEYGDTRIISNAIGVWNAVYLWTKAVEKAGSLDAPSVIASLETNITLNSPSGALSLNPGSHHLSHNIFIVESNENLEYQVIDTFPNVPPAYENRLCNLISHPDIKKHFIPI